MNIRIELYVILFLCCCTHTYRILTSCYCFLIYVFCVELCCVSHDLLIALILPILRNVTLVLSDSRGVPVQEKIGDPNLIVMSFRGARLQDMVNHAMTAIAETNPATCLITAGINNMTIRNKRSRKVSLVYYDPFNLANHVIRLINRVRSQLIRMFGNIRFGIGGIIGINLNRYNKLKGYSSHQWVVDDAIKQINTYVRLLNQQAKLYHPRLTTKVHTYYRGRPKNNYRLLPDGLHLGNILVDIWVRSLERFHLVNTVGIPPFWNKDFSTVNVQ